MSELSDSGITALATCCLGLGVIDFEMDDPDFAQCILFAMKRCSMGIFTDEGLVRQILQIDVRDGFFSDTSPYDVLIVLIVLGLIEEIDHCVFIPTKLGLARLNQIPIDIKMNRDGTKYLVVAK